MKTMLAFCVCVGLLPAARVNAQPPRDTPPPAIESARRERTLRAAIAAGTATKETYVELAALVNRQGRFADAIEALRGAAALEPESAEAQHRLATFCADAAQRDATADAATKLGYIRDGIAAEDRALALKPDYTEAMTYKNILLLMRANLSNDTTDPTPFTGFAEPFEQTVARMQPVRVGGDIRQPTKVQDRKPVYPADAQAERVQGVVIIEALIDESGSVVNARILRSIPMLDQASLAAVSGWRFTPTNVNGRPVGVLMTVTVNFALQ